MSGDAILKTEFAGFNNGMMSSLKLAG